MRNGRPLRFLAVATGGWIAVRVAVLWPQIDDLPSALEVLAPPVAAAVLPGSAARPWRPAMPRASASPSPGRGGANPIDRPQPLALALAALVGFGRAEPWRAPDQSARPSSPILPPPLVPTPRVVAPGRLAGSAWLLARGGGGGTLLGGQLGGSQAGARLTYAIGRSRRVALAARFATPLEGRGKEAAVGIEWQPGSVPVRLIAEHRFALDGGRGGPTVMAIGGIGPTPLVPGVRVEAYAQAGAIARDGVEAFGEGALRLTTPLTLPGHVRFDLGVGAWGAAQRDARRLDLGPTLGIAMPIAGKPVRLTLDWRQRVAGDARPGSGPAVTIGTDF